MANGDLLRIPNHQTTTSTTSTQPTRPQQRVDLRSSPPYLLALNTSRAVSFILAVRNMYETAQGRRKLTLPNIIGLSYDMILAANFISESMNALYKRLGYNARISVPFASLEQTLRLDKLKFISPARMTMFARYGFIGAASNLIYDFASSPDFEDNASLFAATITKDILLIGVMFFPAWYALTAFVAIEVIWHLIRHRIENSKIEIYIENSLFYEEKRYRSPSMLTWYEKILFPKLDSGLTSVKLIETLNTADPEELKRTGVSLPSESDLGSIRSLLDYLADLYDRNPSLYKAALTSEVASLFGAIRDYEITVERKDLKDHNAAYLKENDKSLWLRSRRNIKLSETLSKDAGRFIVSFYSGDKSGYADLPQSFIALDDDKKRRVINITEAILSLTTISEAASIAFNETKASSVKRALEREGKFELSAYDIADMGRSILKNAALFAITGDKEPQIYKYALIYAFYSQGGGRGGKLRAYAKIDKCKLSAMSSTDHEALERMGVRGKENEITNEKKENQR